MKNNFMLATKKGEQEMFKEITKGNYFCHKCGNCFVLTIEKKRICPSCGSNLISMKHG